MGRAERRGNEINLIVAPPGPTVFKRKTGGGRINTPLWEINPSQKKLARIVPY